MKLPSPAPGLVLRYAFVWRREFDDGQVEGLKDRPCAVILTAPATVGGIRVYLLPITHAPPSEPSAAIDIPPRVKRHLKLDNERSWIILDEINDFSWPGYDLRPIPGLRPKRIDYGVLPPRFFDTLRAAFLDLARNGRLRRVPRG